MTSSTLPDSLAIQNEASVKTTYHNDRTWKQAEAINAFLIQEGIKPEQLEFKTTVEPGEDKDEAAVVVVKATVL